MMEGGNRSSRTTFIVVIGGVTAISLALYTQFRGRKNKNRLRRLQRTTHDVKVELLPNERGPVICMGPPPSTVTFFRGDKAAAEEHFSKRVSEIVHAMPWLASVLEYDENGIMAVYYPSCPTMACKLCRFEVRDDIQLSRRRPDGKKLLYPEMVQTLESALCKTSVKSVGTSEPLFKVSLIPDAEEPLTLFALVVSANHSLLDGHGYYRIFNMLSSDCEVQALSPVRKQDMPSKILEAMGGEPSLMSESPPGFLFRFIGGQLYNYMFPATKAVGFYISEEWIAEQKKKNNNNDDVKFVSTNDILVSTFCNLLDCDIALMAINFRGRINDCGHDDVGNYEDLMTYTRADYATPSLIRRSVSPPEGQHYGGRGTPRAPMPTNWEHASKATYGAITNWATFARPLVILGSISEKNNGGEAKEEEVVVAQQELHLPLFDFNATTPAHVFGANVIFRAGGGAAGRPSLGVMVAGKAELIEAVKMSGMIGGPLEDIEM